MTLDELIHSELKEAQSQIQANMASKGINASGRTSASIRIVRYEGGIKLVGGGDDAAPLPTVEIGRKAGKVPYNFADILREWADAKGIDINPWAVVMTIKKKGTVRHRDQSKQKDVYSTISKETIERLRKGIGQVVMSQIREAIRTNF